MITNILLSTTIALLSLSFLLNIVLIIFIVRFREHYDKCSAEIRKNVNGLVKELTLRLPPRPYGVGIEDDLPSMTLGPQDSRINR